MIETPNTPSQLRDALETTPPKPWRMITEDGEVVNFGDYIRQQLAGVDVFGQTITAEYTPFIERKPLPAISDIRYVQVPDDGHVTVANGQTVIDGTDAKQTLYTANYGRYLPGILGLAGIGIEARTPNTGTYEWGYGNGIGNRIGFSLTNGVYRTFVESGGVRYYNKLRSEWLDPLDGTGPSGITADLSRATYRLIIGWYGTIPTDFFVTVGDRAGKPRLVLVDRADLPTSGFVIEQPDSPVFAEATGGILRVGGMQYGVFGRYEPEYRITTGFASKNSITSAAFVPVVSFRLKSAEQWKGVPIYISGFSILTTNAADVAVFIAPALTDPSWISVPGIDASETALEIDLGATALTGGYLSYGDVVDGGTGNNRFSQGSSDIPTLQVPTTNIVTVAVRAVSTSTDVRVAFRMREEW